MQNWSTVSFIKQEAKIVYSVGTVTQVGLKNYRSVVWFPANVQEISLLLNIQNDPEIHPVNTASCPFGSKAAGA
jgi:hypothetical protein